MALYLLSVLLSRLPVAAEIVAVPVSLAGWGLARISGLFPFALVEVLFVAYAAWRITGLVRGVGRVFRRQRRLRNAAGGFGLVVLGDAGIAVALFYALWGLGYARAPLETRLAWSEPVEGPVTERLAALADRMVDDTNGAYVALHGTEDAGEPTSIADTSAVDRAAEEGWLRAAETLGANAPVTWPRPAAKRLVLSPVLHRLGLAGFYCPYTGEANLNAGVPAAYYPHVLAHEKAHQRGFHPEDEANFLGWLAGASSSDPLSRYSASLFAQRQLLFALLRTDPDTAEILIAHRHPGVQRDVDDLRAYWERGRGRATDLARRLNDAYLRTNRVEGGIDSYGRSVELLLRWADVRGGRLTPGQAVGARSSTSRTFRESVSSVNGFWMKSARDNDTPCFTIASSLYPDM